MALAWPQDSSPFWLSLRIAGAATVVAGIAGLFAARALHRWRGPGRRVVDTLLLLPLVLPPTAVGFALLILFGANGVLGRALRACCDASLVFTGAGAVLAAAVAAFPIVYQACRGAFAQVDRRFEQAARTAGAGSERIFWRVLLPLARPGVVAGLLLAFARALGEFGATLLLAGNIPGVTQTMPLALFFDVEAGDFARAAVWAILLAAVALGVVIAVRSIEEAKERAAPVPQPRAPALGPSGAAVVIDVDVELPGFRLEARLSGGHRLGILGPSGAGKSVLLLAVAGLLRPRRGVIRLGGRTLFDSERGIDLPPRERNVGLLFQHYALFPHLDVTANVAFGLRGDATPRVRELLASFDLLGFDKRYPAELSGGQQQRVALARALAPRPAALLLDEPLAALDGPLRERLEGELATTLESYGGPALFVTHRPGEAYRLCDDVAVLDGGQTVACAPRDVVFSRPPTVSAARLVGFRWISPARRIGPEHVEALGWNVRLQVRGEVRDVSFVAIRSGALAFLPAEGVTNRFPCWPASVRETAEGVAVGWKLGPEPSSARDSHGETELPRAQWLALQCQPRPWSVAFPPDDIVVIP